MNFRFHDKVFLRLPRYIIHKKTFAADLTIEMMMKDVFFLEAVYVASPVVYDKCIKFQTNALTSADVDMLELTLAKYYTRMSTRSTPFGLFSGVGITSWGKGDVVFNPGKIRWRRKARLDFHFLAATIKKISNLTVAKRYSVYFLNNSGYKINNEFRYVEFFPYGFARKYQIAAIKISGLIEEVFDLTITGATFIDLERFLVKNGIDVKAANEFLDYLIESKVLTSAFEPSPVGTDILQQISNNIKALIGLDLPDREMRELHDAMDFINALRSDLQHVNENNTLGVGAYKNLYQRSKLIIPNQVESNLIQVDSFFEGVEEAVSADYKVLLAQSFTFLNSFFEGNNQDKELNLFSQQFSEKYGDRFMPLNLIMDYDSGLGYPVSKNFGYSPFVNDIDLHQSPREAISIKWNYSNRLLFKKIMAGRDNRAYEISLTDNDLPIRERQTNNLPSTLSALFRLINNDSYKIQLEGFFGPSAVNAISRFAYIKTDIADLAKDIISYEENELVNCIDVEIIHIPSDKAANIVQHPDFGQYNLAYLGNSNKSGKYSVNINDLYLKCMDGVLLLWSKKLKCFVRPRLNSMHNYSSSNLPVYRFLCDFQKQNLKNNISFQWGDLLHCFEFFPRVTYGKVILYPAMWKLDRSDLHCFYKNDGDKSITELIEEFVNRFRFPRYVVLADGDNELLIDFETQITFRFLLKAAKNRSQILIKEFLYHEDEHTISANQLMGTVLIDGSKEFKMYRNFPHETRMEPGNDAPEPEWLYFKIYCGESSADHVLLNYLKPVTDLLIEAGLITMWFFIRYYDPYFHLRFRVKLIDDSNKGKVYEIICRYLQKAVQMNLVSRLSTDNYIRELDRYGDKSIDLTEGIFHLESINFLDFLVNFNSNEWEEKKWMFAVVSVDSFFNTAGFSSSDKVSHLKKSLDAFYIEFNVGKEEKKALNLKYRKHRDKLQELLSNDKKYDRNDSDISFIKHIVSANQKGIAGFLSHFPEKKKENAVFFSELRYFSSVTHMTLNRVFSFKPRTNEMVIYYFIYNYYLSHIAINSKK
ncbi:thiopeptide-type bacteriocin biosynthesis protein [Chitinophaga sp. W3I9]|uniref:lantibiotic dehydratase n=1 Tax=Chitinophaga sp. W3I9 TaxID=3373924 RepID=UPI003D20042C